MFRELFFPTPIYIADIEHPTLNQELERDIINWAKRDKGMTRTNIKGWPVTTIVNGNVVYENEQINSQFLGSPVLFNENPNRYPMETFDYYDYVFIDVESLDMKVVLKNID